MLDLEVKNKNIVVEKFDVAEKNSKNLFGSIVVGDNYGEIKAVCPTVEGYAVGDRVFFGSHRETIHIGSNKYFVMKTDNIIAKAL